MRKIIRYAAGVVLVVSLAFVFWGARSRYTYAAGIGEQAPRSYNYLFVGFDEAAKNTDVLCLVNYVPKTAGITVIQIPRDTYCRFGASQNKINQYFPYLLSKGSTEKSAMEKLAKLIEGQFGVRLDGYVGIDPTTLSSTIDALGGVNVYFEEDVTLKNGEKTIFSFPRGEHLLSGREALILIRHRASYIGGDLQRLDAQKIFIKGLISTLRSGIGARSAIRAAKSAGSGLRTDISFYEAAKLFLGFRSLKQCDLAVSTLPGEAIKDTSGVWYYILTKETASEMISKHFHTDRSAFDKNGLFTDPQKAEFGKIYYKKKTAS